MIRTSNDICLLCQIEKATKTTSHIVPKFITKGIFGSSIKKKAYIFDSSLYRKNPAICQDSAKEDYILCPSCEDYLMVLETYFAEYFHKRISNKLFNADFKYNNSLNGINYANCLKANATVIRLFFYSIFWRCSITSKVPFNDFQIKEENTLRIELLRSKSPNIKTILEKENSNKILNNNSLIVIKSTDKENQTSNIVYARVTKDNLYGLISNEYISFLAFNDNLEISQFKKFTNKTNNAFLTILADNELWTSLRNVIIDDIRDTKTN